MHFAGVFLALTAFSTLSIAGGNDDLTTFCNNFSMQGTSLVGTCKLKNGSTVQASIDLTKCIEVNTSTYEMTCNHKYVTCVGRSPLTLIFERCRGDNSLDNCSCVPWDESPGNLSFQCKCLFPPLEDQYTNTLNLGKSSYIDTMLNGLDHITDTCITYCESDGKLKC